MFAWVDDLIGKWGEKARNVVAIGTVASVIIGLGVYAIQFEARLRSLETQVQALAGQPREAVQSGDPIGKKCAELAQRRADYTRRSDQQDVEAAMTKLGCGSAQR